MNLDAKWVPMKWPCGPLEWAVRRKAKNVDADLQETLAAWAQPAALDLLKGTPVNCLIVRWAEGAPEDSAQQEALKPLIAAGRQRGISFVSKVAAGQGNAVGAARAAGLDAVMLAGLSGGSFDLPAIRQFPRDKVAWESATPIFSATDNEWPGLKLETMKGDTAVAGPTGVPWVDSNGWFSLLAGELAHAKTLWLDFDPPDSSTLAYPANYPLAVADSQAYGSRWIVSLDDRLRAALAKENPQARSLWNKTCEIITFFERHGEWNAFRQQGLLAVVSDFRDDNSGEVLNLLNRRQVQFQVMERTQALATPVLGLKAILWLDKDAPTSGQLVHLLAFVRQGGLLIAPTYWGQSGIPATKKDPSLNYKMYNLGKGQIAVTEEGFLDPYQVALDVHVLVSRRNDLVRLYNPEATNGHLSLGPARKAWLVQVVNYSSRIARFIGLWVNAHARSSRLWAPGTRDSAFIAGTPAAPGTQFNLPPVAVNCAVEFEVEGSSL